MPAASKKISQELWDMVADNLPALSASYAATAFDFRLRPQQQRHAAIWDAIFQDPTWICKANDTGYEPVLMGKDLDRCWRNDVSPPESPYLVLLANPFQSRSERKLFLQSLRGYKAQGNHGELHLNSGVTLNVTHLYDSNNRLPVKISDLFDRYKRVRIAVLFWQGSTIEFVHVETIVGARGMDSVLKSFLGYRLTLEYVGGTRAQYRFESHTRSES